MILYLDTSALAKRYIREAQTATVTQWIEQADLFGTSLITRAEMSAVIGRAYRMQAIGAARAELILIGFRKRWPSYIRLPLTEGTVTRADKLAWEYDLRGYDAVHLASAVLWQEALEERVTLATYDRQLWEAAIHLGLDALPAGR